MSAQRQRQVTRTRRSLTLSCALRAKDGDHVVGEALVFEPPFPHKQWKVIAGVSVSLASDTRPCSNSDARKGLVVRDDLDNVPAGGRLARHAIGGIGRSHADRASAGTRLKAEEEDGRRGGNLVLRPRPRSETATGHVNTCSASTSRRKR
jgi:hypothetical protein